jgi:hypothetical protein
MSDLISRALIWQTFETYERDISIKNRRKKGTFDSDYPKPFLCKVRKEQGRKSIPKT